MKRFQTKRLLNRIQRFDTQALAEVYDFFAPKIYGYVYRRTGHAETAQELTSETFHRLLVALKNKSGPRDNLSAWLYRVAHNLIVDDFRQQPQQQAIELDEEVLARPHPDQAEHRVTTLADEARAAIRQLTILQQQVIVLRFLEGFSLKETAQIVQKDVSAVKALQHRALYSLRRILEAPADDY
ncbi:MAG: sigma-70 family RNA polymerase sigma factor [Anaerolineae bacterium]|nr:sigma-70 family RNA polymerase sigma factor [Anaerolineae bacterium]